jgi:hypothetical protein
VLADRGHHLVVLVDRSQHGAPQTQGGGRPLNVVRRQMLHRAVNIQR